MKRTNQDYDSYRGEKRREKDDEQSRQSGGRIAVLAGVGVVAAALIIAGFVKGCGSSTDKQGAPDSMQAVFEQYMEADGNALDALDSLSESERERVLSAAVSTLERLIGDGAGGYDRNEVISELEKVLMDMDLGLPESTVHTIAEKLVELYTSHYNEVYTDAEKTSASVKHLEENVTNQMQENLYTITDYLTQLDTEIVTNQSTLEQVLDSAWELGTSVTELNTKTEQIKNQIASALTEINNGFTSVDARLTQTQEKLDAYYAKHNEAISTGVANIQTSITETRNQIASAQQEITNTLSEMENKNVTRQNEINKNFSSVEDSIKATQDQLKKVEENVSDTLKDMEGQMEDNQEALEKQLEKNQTELKDQLAQDQKELVVILSELESSLTDTLAQNMETISQHFNSLQESVAASFAQLQENIDYSVMELKAQMDDIHQQIMDTQSQIIEVLNAMDEKRDLQYEDIMDAINDAVLSINTEMENAHDSLETLILQLKADGEADHAETLEKLQGMEGSLSASMESSLSQINTSFSDLNSSLAQYFAQMKEEQGAGQEQLGNAIGELGNNLQENQQVLLDALEAHDSANRQGQAEIKDAIKAHDVNMVTGFGDLSSTIGTHNENVRSYIEELKGYLAEKLDQVFTFVSNGKRLMASALLTKGVTIDEDATFSEFAEAILNVPQKLVIGVQEVPGEIEYDYHYHTDASGNRVGEVQTSDVQGGCYTVAVYHSHSDSCYNWSHEHTDDCDTHTYWVDWNPSSPEGYWATSYTCGDQPLNVRGSLKCGMSTGTPIYYKLGCGLSDGQIIAAHIVYNHGAVAASAYSMVEEPQIKESLVAMARKPLIIPERTKTDDVETAETDEETEETAPEGKETEAESGEGGTENPADSEAEESPEDSTGTQTLEESEKSESEPAETSEQTATEEQSIMEEQAVPESKEPSNEAASIEVEETVLDCDTAEVAESPAGDGSETAWEEESTVAE